MKLIPDDRLYELLRIENLYKLADMGDYINPIFYDDIYTYLKEEENIIISKIMTEYEDYPRE